MNNLQFTVLILVCITLVIQIGEVKQAVIDKEPFVIKEVEKPAKLPVVGFPSDDDLMHVISLKSLIKDTDFRVKVNSKECDYTLIYKTTPVKRFKSLKEVIMYFDIDDKQPAVK